MARPLRIQYEGALYHITCRGNERRNIFRNDDDRREFLSVLEKSLTICSVKLFAYVLMSNHFHLLVETPLGNFSEFVEKETGRDVEAIKKDKGDLRRLVMELLYRHGRLKGPEIGAIFGID